MSEKKQGYTWWPKDWQSDDKVFQLTLAERGLYRELIDMAMQNDNQIEPNIALWCRKFNSSHEELRAALDTLLTLDLLRLPENNYMVPSCEKRLVAIRSGRRGGSAKNENKGFGANSAKDIHKGSHKGSHKQTETETETETKINTEVYGSEAAIPTPKVSLKETINHRQEQFRISLIPYVDAYGKEMVRDFYNYWSERNKSQTKMKWELERTFEIPLRLSTWAKRDNTFNKSQNKNDKPNEQPIGIRVRESKAEA